MKNFFVLIVLVVAVMLSGCASGLTSKTDVIDFFNKNEELILNAIATNDFEKVEELNGIEDIYISAEYIDFRCGGAGMGSETNYYGFYYSSIDDLDALGYHSPDYELVPDGDGYKYEEADGDNEYYVEKIGEHFFYYEAHF